MGAQLGRGDRVAPGSLLEQGRIATPQAILYGIDKMPDGMDLLAQGGEIEVDWRDWDVAGDDSVVGGWEVFGVREIDVWCFHESGRVNCLHKAVDRGWTCRQEAVSCNHVRLTCWPGSCVRLAAVKKGGRSLRLSLAPVRGQAPGLRWVRNPLDDQRAAELRWRIEEATSMARVGISVQVFRRCSCPGQFVVH